MNSRTGLTWMGLAVGLSTAALGGVWLGLARMGGLDAGALAILSGLALLALVMASRCGQLALAQTRVSAGCCASCGAVRRVDTACPRCGTD